MDREPRGGRGRVMVGLGLLGASVACLAGLRALPFSTSYIVRGSDSEALARPGSTYTHGPLTWNLDAYRTDGSLQVFRDVFEAPCGKETGIPAARCVVDLIHQKSPHGVPAREFLDQNFDPAAVFQQHMAGAPGHCTAKSFMAATSLLALGVPARVVQLIPSVEGGHTVIEVWDPEHGWALFDPDNDSSFLHGDDFVSASTLTTISGGLRWRRPHDSAPDPNFFAGATVHYPDPWLYTRVGSPAAPWPFRGAFVQIGRSQFELGPAQRLCLGGVGLFALAALATAASALLRRSPQRTPALVGSVSPESAA